MDRAPADIQIAQLQRELAQLLLVLGAVDDLAHRAGQRVHDRRRRSRRRDDAGPRRCDDIVAHVMSAITSDAPSPLQGS